MSEVSPQQGTGTELLGPQARTLQGSNAAILRDPRQKSLYTRSIPFGGRVYVPGDPKGEHTAVAEAVGGKAIALGHGMANRLNPLDEGHRPGGLDDSGHWQRPCSSVGSPR